MYLYIAIGVKINDRDKSTTTENRYREEREILIERDKTGIDRDNLMVSE